MHWCTNVAICIQNTGCDMHFQKNIFVCNCMHSHIALTMCHTIKSRITYARFITCAHLLHHIWMNALLPSVHVCFITCAQIIHHMCTNASSHVHKCFITCAWMLHHMCTNASSHVHKCFITCAKMLHHLYTNASTHACILHHMLQLVHLCTNTRVWKRQKDKRHQFIWLDSKTFSFFREGKGKEKKIDAETQEKK